MNPFRVGDRVKFKTSKGWPHHGTVTALGIGVNPASWERYETVQIKWDVGSIMFTPDLYWDVKFVELVEARDEMDWLIREDICEARWLRHIKGLE